jgi:hypothetical protein
MLPLLVAIHLGVWGLPPSLPTSSPTPIAIASQSQEINKPNNYQNRSNPNLTPDSSDKHSNSRAKDQKKKSDRWEKLVAKATVWIAAFTVLLFVATILLWWGGEKHSERELRAYLSVTPNILLDWFVGQNPGVDCVIKNHGQTPAFEINYVFEANILIAGSTLPDATRVQNRNDSVFPNGEVSTRFFSAQTFTQNQLLSVEAGTHRFYIWGVMSYVDSFKKRRQTQLSMSVGGPDFAVHMNAVRAHHPTPPGFRWVYGERHNSEIEG